MAKSIVKQKNEGTKQQLYFFHSSSHITSSVPQVLLTMLELVLACV